MKKSIALRLSFWICSFLAVVFLGLTVLVSSLAYRKIGERLNIEAATLTADVATKMDKVFLQMQGVAHLLAEELEASHKTKEDLGDYARNRLLHIHSSCTDIIGLAITYNPGMLDGDEYYNTVIDLLENGTDRLIRWHDKEINYDKLKDWYIIPTTKNIPYWTSPFIAVNGMMIASYSVPFYQDIDGKQEIAGVVVLDYDVSTMVKYLNGLNAESCTFLMDPFGRITASTEREYILNETLVSLCETEKGTLAKDFDTCRDILGRNEMSDLPSYKGRAILKNTRIKDGGAHEIFYQPCANHWVVAVAVPQNWRLGVLLPVICQVILAGIAILALVVAVIFITCKRINVPLMKLSTVSKEIGFGNFNVQLPDYHTDDEIGLLTHSFEKMQLALNDYVGKLKKSVVMEGEINAARNIQKALLPTILPNKFPPFDGFENIAVSADLIAAHGVGGDLFDVFPLTGDVLAVIVGDVSGKGVPAALFMAITQVLQRTLAKSERTPSSLVSKLNEMLAKNENIGLFVTYWAGFIDVRTGVLSYTSAGHNPPLIRHKDGTVEKLTERHGPPIGIMGGRLYNMASYQMSDGDILVCYTDGVTEATNKDEQMLGEEKLIEVVSQEMCANPMMLMMSVRDAVFEFTGDAEQYDDVTIVATQIKLPGNK